MRDRKGTHHMESRFWPSRQRVVVLTFDSPDDAARFDVGLHELMYAVRDVLDCWGDGDDVDPDAMDRHVHAMRRALFELRQAAMRDV